MLLVCSDLLEGSVIDVGAVDVVGVVDVVVGDDNLTCSVVTSVFKTFSRKVGRSSTPSWLALSMMTCLNNSTDCLSTSLLLSAPDEEAGGLVVVSDGPVVSNLFSSSSSAPETDVAVVLISDTFRTAGVSREVPVISSETSVVFWTD